MRWTRGPQPHFATLWWHLKPGWGQEPCRAPHVSPDKAPSLWPGGKCIEMRQNQGASVSRPTLGSKVKTGKKEGGSPAPEDSGATAGGALAGRLGPDGCWHIWPSLQDPESARHSQALQRGWASASPIPGGQKRTGKGKSCVQSHGPSTCLREAAPCPTPHRGGRRSARMTTRHQVLGKRSQRGAVSEAGRQDACSRDPRTV